MMVAPEAANMLLDAADRDLGIGDVGGDGAAHLERPLSPCVISTVSHSSDGRAPNM
jgi:hypothetical protein